MPSQVQGYRSREVRRGATNRRGETEMLWLMFVNAVWCEVYWLIDAQEAGEAYAHCLSTATDAEARLACFYGFFEAVGNATIDFLSCMY